MTHWSNKKASSAFRKAVGAGLAGFFLSLGGGNALAAPPAPAETDQPADAQQLHETAHQTGLAHFLDLSKTDYSGELERLRKEYMPLLPESIRVVGIIDPDAADSVVPTIGSMAQYIQYGLLQEGILVTEAYARRMAGYLKKNPVILGPDLPTTLMSSPVSISMPSFQLCIIVPSSYGTYSNILLMDGLSPEEITTFANRHEFRHCTDGKYIIPPPEAGVPLLQKLPNDEIRAKKEAYADLSSLGDMIVRENKAIDVIDKVKAYRIKMGFIDVQHYSAPALEALKTEMQVIGV